MNKPWGSKLPTFTHQESTPDSSSLQALLASWKMLEGSPEHGYQNGSISKLADTQTWLLDVGKIVLHDWVYQWICGIPHSWTNPYLVFTGGARIFEV